MTKQRYAVQFIIEEKDYKGWDMGKSFIEDVEELVLEDQERRSLITSSSVEVYDGERLLPLRTVEEN